MAEKTIELLSPAGDMERLRMSLAYGADAVYLAGPDFGMRSFAGNFTPEELRQAVELCHSRGVAVHVTCNTMPRNDEAARLPEWLEFLQAAGVDAAILADVGVLSLLKKHAPGVKAHISTQASVSNYQAAAAWYELGASRVILARELSLDEIREIRAKAPPALELEAFVHGAMCVSYSGRCLLSNYMTGRDANRGACAQPCRYQYALVEEQRPGEYFPIGEDAGGAFILNSRDMCMIDHVPELMDAGLDSLKIEGRAKSAYYAAIVTAAYRHAIDAVQAGEPLAPVWRAEVDKVSHRPYSTGFYYGEPVKPGKELAFPLGVVGFHAGLLLVLVQCGGGNAGHIGYRFHVGIQLQRQLFNAVTLELPLRGFRLSHICKQLELCAFDRSGSGNSRVSHLVQPPS